MGFLSFDFQIFFRSSSFKNPLKNEYFQANILKRQPLSAGGPQGLRDRTQSGNGVGPKTERDRTQNTKGIEHLHAVSILKKFSSFQTVLVFEENP